MTITFVLGTLEYISANFINPYTGEVLEIEGEYYVNDTAVDGGTGTADILLGSTHNQFFSLEDPMGNILLEDLEVFLMAAGHDIINLSSDTVELGNTEIEMAEGDDIVWANVGDDLIGGSVGDDILNGGPGNDTLNGDEDNDILIGWTGDDTLNGGTGNDTLEGGADNDVYMFAPGDGTDIITETSGLDTLVFTDGIILTDLAFTQVGDDLQIDLDVGGLTSAITVTGFYLGDPDLTVETAEFDDGSSFDLLSLLAPPNLGAPDAVNDAVTFNSDDGSVIGDVTGNDVASPDGPTLLTQVTFGVTTVSVPTDGSDVSITGLNGVLTINNSGAYSYSPFPISAVVESVVDTFEYTVGDVDGDLDTATLEITTINDDLNLGDPDAVDDTVSFDYDDGSVTGNVTDNDTDSPDGGTAVSVVAFGGTSVTVPNDGTDVTVTGDHGILTINCTGAYSYSPFAIDSDMASVLDQFEYTLSDMNGDTDTASLDITTLNDINNVINGTSGNDVLSGGAGDDIIDGLGGSDKLLGGDGDDTLLYSNDAIWTSGFVAWNVGAPDAVINGDKVTVAPRYRSYDNFDGGEGTDTLIMGDDGEALFLDDRYSDNPDGYNTARLIDIEIIRAGDGDDIVDLTSKQFSYDDVSIYGDGGNDVLWGNAGNDYIEGGTGNDHLDGASGNDTLFGGAGNDRMFGQSGDDTFIVGEGNDKIYTGSGADTIVYNAVDSKSDHVFDFAADEGDRLDLSDILEGYDVLTDAISDFVTVAQQGANTIVSVDVDGGADSFVQIAKLHGVSGLGDAQSLEDTGTLITM